MANRYAIIGGTLWGNRGAEAMVVTTIGRLRERNPDARFHILSYFAREDRRLVNDPAIVVDDASPATLLLLHLPFALLCWGTRHLGLHLPDAILPTGVRRLRACKALLDVSGISFHDGRLPVTAYNVVCNWPALLLGVPVWRLSQAMGPFANPVNRWWAKRIMAHCAQSFARGRLTAAYAQGLGLPDDRWSIAADVAFSFQPSDSLTHESEAEVGQLVSRLRSLKAAGATIVAITPSSLVAKKAERSGGDYVSLIVSLIDQLHAKDCHVLVVPNATRAGSDKARNNDLVVIAALKQALETEGRSKTQNVSWVLYDLNTKSIRALIGQCDLLITSRFHAMVAALALTVPTLVIGWSHKYREVLEMFGCEGDAVDFAAAGNGMAEAVDRMLAERAQKRARIAQSLPAVIASSRRQFDLMLGDTQ